MSKTLIRSIPISLVILLAGATNSINAKEYIVPPMVSIPAGSFMMGTEGGDPATQPIHSVHVDKFQMGKYAVTVAEFRKFAQDTGYKRDSTCNDFIDKEGLRGPTYEGTGRWDKHRESHSEFQPVVCISWQDANAYADWLSEKTGQNFRLPSEQEWEYAAKAHTTTRYFWGEDPNMTQACKYGNFADLTGEYSNNETYGLSNVGWIGHVNCDDGEAYNAIVGLYRPNPFGLYDMLGNTSEFVNSCYDEKGYNAGTNKDQDVAHCEFVVHRGGNWHYPAVPVSTRNRWKLEGWNVGSDIGFRLVLDGEHDQLAVSNAEFETQLKQAQSRRLSARKVLLPAPQSTQIAHITGNKYMLSWQPVDDIRVTGYEILRATASHAHLFAGYYRKHFQKVKTVPANTTSTSVELTTQGGSFRVVAISKEQSSLSSPSAVIVESPEIVSIPGRFDMRYATSLHNVPLYFFEANDKRPEAYNVFKTNKNSDNSLVSATFNIEVKQSGHYLINYNGRTFHKGGFFKLWLGNQLLSEIDYNPDIDDKTSSRHKVYLEQGRHQLELTVMRDKFDRWGLGWLEFTQVGEQIH